LDLLVLPLFIMTGDLINAASIAIPLSDFAYSMLGFCSWWAEDGIGISLRYLRGYI
jgi:TRAP-type C4-dicarboxylate transport system permease large subunit|tara:strand:- start:18 stop:185 length:168 start_codon:yes stop_codon:yes gene_type:complete